VSRCAWRVTAIVAAAAVACNRDATSKPSRQRVASAPAPAVSGSAPAASGPAAAPSAAASPASSAAPPGDERSCEPLPFAGSTPVPEASGAAWLDIDGKAMLVVAGDSGNRGAYSIVDPDTGATTETGALPLTREASDDLEGLAVRGGLMYGITSSGWIWVWRRVAKGFELAGTPYPIAPEGSAMVCAGRKVNCGRNYEGLCLAPAPRGDCVGFAASKADGHLYCLTDDGGKLVVHRDRAIEVVGRDAVSDCAFGDDGTLWVGNNVFDLGNVYRVVHWEVPATATVERLGALAIGFPEVIAVRGDVVYRMSDTGSAPSLMARFRCRR
jgi:hypothetical protein